MIENPFGTIPTLEEGHPTPQQIKTIQQVLALWGLLLYEQGDEINRYLIIALNVQSNFFPRVTYSQQ